MHLVLVAGEASGDLLGADLIEGLRRHWPQAQFSGVGGEAMRAAGMHTWFDSDELAIMGLTEVLRHLPRLLRRRRQVVRQALDCAPQAFIGIDAPDFNLSVERRLRKTGLRTIHYVSPSIWAWRQKRAKTIGRSAELVLTLFPFEPGIYREFGVDARFVGHPGARRLPLEPDREAARKKLGIEPSTVLAALLPGSRAGELKRLGEPFAAAAARLAADNPGLHFVAPCANPRTRSALEQQLEHHRVAQRCTLLDGQATTALTAADVALVASGTATLEALLCKTPMIVSYKIAPSTYFLVHALGMMKASRFSLPNALAGGEELVSELMQDRATPEALAGAMQNLIDQPALRRQMQDRFAQIHRQLLGETTAADVIARHLA